TACPLQSARLPRTRSDAGHRRHPGLGRRSRSDACLRPQGPATVDRAFLRGLRKVGHVAVLTWNGPASRPSWPISFAPRSRHEIVARVTIGPRARSPTCPPPTWRLTEAPEVPSLGRGSRKVGWRRSLDGS